LEFIWSKLGVTARSSRNRLQIELAPRHQRLLLILGKEVGNGGDAETTRWVFDIVENITDHIRQGYKLAVVPVEDEHTDAVPELTRALRPESNYSYLLLRPHAWRRQLSFKGRRLTVGQFLGRMRTKRWTPEQAAAEFEIPIEAAYEAIDYGERYAALIAAEDAEDARAAKSLVHAASP
jgi:uncharacterized protein (DUF433 family)